MAHGGGPSRRKSNLPIDDNSSEDEIRPPDAGWGWVLFRFIDGANLLELVYVILMSFFFIGNRGCIVSHSHHK